MIDYKKQGKQNREKGARFERKVRKDLEKQGWIVDKFTNNIDLENSCFVPAKTNKWMSRSCGFPDFIAFMPIQRNRTTIEQSYKVMMVECKVNGTLSKEEKLKMEWLDGEGFKCWVASEDGKSVEYKRPNKIRRKNPEHKT